MGGGEKSGAGRKPCTDKKMHFYKRLNTTTKNKNHENNKNFN